MNSLNTILSRSKTPALAGLLAIALGATLAQADSAPWKDRLAYRARVARTDAAIQADVIEELSSLNTEARVRSLFATVTGTGAATVGGALAGGIFGLHLSAATYLLLSGQMSESLALGIIFGSETAGGLAGLVGAPLGAGAHVFSDSVLPVPPPMGSGTPTEEGYQVLMRTFASGHDRIDGIADQKLAAYDGVTGNGFTLGWRTVDYLEIQLSRAEAHRGLYELEARMLEGAAGELER